LQLIVRQEVPHADMYTSFVDRGERVHAHGDTFGDVRLPSDRWAQKIIRGRHQRA
jgi:hypothetical protein